MTRSPIPSFARRPGRRAAKPVAKPVARLVARLVAEFVTKPASVLAPLAAGLMLLLAGSIAAQAADRLAFVVGVDTYPNLGPGAQLERPVADARSVAGTLEGLGFKVTLLSGTVTQEAMLRRFGAFKERLQAGDTVLVYFAGHGIAIQGTNYLLPSDVPAIEPGQELLARTRSLAETDLSAELRERGARVVVMVIDACRDNPFPRNGTRSVGLGRGLARVEPADGVFSLYAAGAGQQALDRLPGNDPNPNSVFTRVFVDRLRRSDLNLIDLGESVRDDVARLAEGASHRQVPAYYNEVRGARFISLAKAEPLPETPKPLSPAPLPAPLPAAPASALPAGPPADAPASPPAAAVARPAPPSVQAALPPREAPREAQRLASFSYPTGLDFYGDNWVALRSLPSGQEGIRLRKLGPEALFTVLGRQGDWVSVRLREGGTGWIHRAHVGCCRTAPMP